MSITVPLKSLELPPGNSLAIKNATWQQYLYLTNYLEQESINYRISYFNHTIELMSPDRKHENPKDRLYGLIRDYCLEKSIRYYSCGSADIKKPQIAGKQPDTSLCFGVEKEIPDLAVEVINTSGTVKKLHQIYLEFGIQELWIWQKQEVSFYELKSETYELVEESLFLAGLTVDLVNKCLSIADEWDASQEFRRQIK